MDDDPVPAPRAPGKWTVFAVVAVGVFMATLDSSIVNVSLPAIARSFGAPIGAAVEWVIIAYLVVVASLLLTIGRMADLFGRKRIWAAGLAVFTAGSAACGAAPSLALLIVARSVQGIGGALLMAISPALLTSAFPPQQRGRAIGLNAVTVALGVSAGPTLGGLITEHLSWRWIFFINLPIGVGGLLATLRLLPRDRTHAVERFDPLGAVFLAIALAALTGGLSVGNEAAWRSPWTVGLLAVAAAAGVVFAVHERRHADPIVDFALFRDRLFASASASLVLSFLAMFAVSFLLPFYFEDVRGFDAAKTGLLLTPMPLTLAVVAPISGALADRVGTRFLTSVGLAIACAGLVLIGGIGPDTPERSIILRLAVAGVGAGMFQSPNNSALLGAAPPQRQGVASGLLATGRVVGQSLSVALAGAIFTSLGGAAAGRALASAGGRPADPAQIETFMHAFRWSLWVCAAVAAIGVVTSLVRGRSG